MLDVLWFVLAGFVLGFATSLLWEWLYFRKRRIEWRDGEVDRLHAQNDALRSQLEQRADGFIHVADGPVNADHARMPSADYQSNAARTGSEQPNSTPSPAPVAPRPGEAIPVPPSGKRGQNQPGRVIEPSQTQQAHSHRVSEPASAVVERTITERTVSESTSTYAVGAVQNEAETGSNGEIGAFNIESILDAKADAPLNPEPLTSAVSADTTALPTSRDAQMNQPDRWSSQAQSKLASVTTVQPDPTPRPHAEQHPQQSVDPNFIQQAYTDPERNEAAADLQYAATDQATMNDGYLATDPLADSDGVTAEQAMESFDAVYGQRTADAYQPQSDQADTQPAPSAAYAEQVYEELGHEADVNFFAESKPQGIPTGEQLASDHFADEHTDTWREDDGMQDAISNHQPQQSDDHEVLTVSSLLRSSKKSGDTNEFESAVALPADLIDAPARGASTNGASSGGIRRIRKAELDYPDDLTKVKGIGKVFQERLYANGIFTWDQLGKSKPETVEAATQPRINEDVSDWIAQARTLASYHNRVGATFSGPVPDDLTEVDGLTKRYMDLLYQNGIMSYSQLAKTKKSKLTQLFSGIAGADKINFTDWAKAARSLARKK